ncbi:hypothetical protein HW555_010779 [Spodoptera exigua]|uniref:NACHT domain-containing protein n=1 Tax=Spodoptera exigua TaxID=7107 RepID=A0A835G8W0_SPOEX|nr:hypothetical protein HW555_010779 [Spodoptera exigua]
MRRNVGPKKILELNHLNTKGIGGTVGNLLQYDKQTQTFAFNTNESALGKNSQYMLKEIKELLKDDLANYRFNVKMNSFPRTCFDPNENDKELAKEYLSKLWFYTNQAKEDEVEDKVKAEIDAHYNANKNENQCLFRVHSDAIFLRFHDEIQKWWKSQSRARYLTKTDCIFDEAKKDIVDRPVLTVLNIMSIRSLKKLAVQFNKNAIKAMNLDELIEKNKIINVTTDAVVLTAAKIMQLVENQNDEEITVNNLNDIDDKVVLITSKPCMGKTILLTHLSLETKKIDPAPWIVKINMSLYTNDYEKWCKKMNMSDVMRFLCKVALKTAIDIKQLKFIEHIDDGTVELNRDSLKVIPAELEWFIHFYNEGKVIFLFDGFDRIYPHHTKEGLGLLVALKRANKRMWITIMDDFLRNPEEEHRLELSGTPLHMYIAANYFKFQITDKFELKLNTEEISKRSAIYLNALTSYERFLKGNIKQICEADKVDSKNIESEQDKIRREFVETHKKLALYAICKEKDISKLLTEAQITQVKDIIRKLESGEMKSYLIDCVVDGIPRFYNELFAEYFLVEQATDMLKAIVREEVDHIKLESIWNFLVNGILLMCPPGVRNAFDYKLKYDPEVTEIANQESSQKILFELILKQKADSEAAGLNPETCLNIAINEGLVNITNLLLRCTRKYVTKDNVDGIVGIIKTGAFVLGAANPSWKELTENMMKCIQNVDGEKLINILNTAEVEGVSRTITRLYLTTENGKALQEKIKSDICEPIHQLAENLVELSGNNENLKSLKELLPYHLPSIMAFLILVTVRETVLQKQCVKLLQFLVAIAERSKHGGTPSLTGK